MRVLFTGLGSIGRRHARLLRDLEPDVDIVAYRTGDRPSDVDGIAEFHDFDAALDTDPDVAFVTNPTFRHVPTALRCARAGCHLFVEKPLSHTLEGVDELIETVEHRDLVTCMGCNLRFHPSIRATRDEIENDAVGTCYSYRVHAGSYLPDWRSDRDHRKTYSAHPEEGGGVVLDLIHELDYARWLFGPVDSVDGTVHSTSHLEIQTEDVAEILFKHTSGVIGSIHLDYYRPENRRDVEITGREGILTADLIDDNVRLERGDESWTESFDVDRDKTYRDQLSYFLGHVRSGRACENDIQTGKRVLELALQAKETFDP